jgi:hypothetical protein
LLLAGGGGRVVPGFLLRYAEAIEGLGLAFQVAEFLAVGQGLLVAGFATTSGKIARASTPPAPPGNPIWKVTTMPVSRLPPASQTLSAPARTWNLSGSARREARMSTSIAAQPAMAPSSSSARGEAGSAAGAEPGLAAAGAGDREHARGDALNGHGAVRRTISHTHALPGNRMASRAAGLRPRQNPYT